MKCIRLPKSQYMVACQESVQFFVARFLGSNESIPPPGSLQQKVIAKVIAKLEHFDEKGKERGT